MALQIYHNPRCSKSRAALEVLQQQGEDVEIIEYLKTPPTAEQLSQLLQMLQIPARKLLRTGEEEYKQLNLANNALSEEEIVAAMVVHPKLIERPIVVKQGKAVIGRPTQLVVDLCNE